MPPSTLADSCEALQRLRGSRLLQASAVLALCCYGALPFLLMYPSAAEPKVHFFPAFVMVLMSLASWTLLFWWYPVFEHTQQVLTELLGMSVEEVDELRAEGVI